MKNNSIAIKLRKYYQNTAEDYENIKKILLNKLTDVSSEELIQSRDYLEGILDCVIEKDKIKEFPIAVDKILNELGYTLFDVNMNQFKFSMNENTIVILGEDKYNKRIFVTDNRKNQNIKFVALAMCLGDYLINKGIISKEQFFTGCILNNKDRLLLNVSKEVTLLDELCYEFALRLLIPKEIYIRLNAIVESAEIEVENEAEALAKIFSVRKEDFLNRIKLERNAGNLYE